MKPPKRWRQAVERRWLCLCASCCAQRPERAAMRDQHRRDVAASFEGMNLQRTNRKAAS